MAGDSFDVNINLYGRVNMAGSGRSGGSGGSVRSGGSGRSGGSSRTSAAIKGGLVAAVLSPFIASFAGTLKAIIQPFFTAPMKAMNRIMEPFSNVMEILFVVVFLPLKKHLANLVNNTAGVIGTVTKLNNKEMGWDKAVIDIKDETSKSISSFFDSLGETTPSISALISGAFLGIIDGLGTALGKFIAETGIWLGDEMIKAGNVLSDALLEVKTAIQNAIRRIPFIGRASEKGFMTEDDFKNRAEINQSRMVREKREKNIESFFDIAKSGVMSLIGGGVADAIISPSGQIITTDPKDFIIATKNPGDLGGGGDTININISGNTIGSDERNLKELAEMITMELQREKLRRGV